MSQPIRRWGVLFALRAAGRGLGACAHAVFLAKLSAAHDSHAVPVYVLHSHKNSYRQTSQTARCCIASDTADVVELQACCSNSLAASLDLRWWHGIAEEAVAKADVGHQCLA